MTNNHFLTLSDLSPATLEAILNRAIALKKMQHRGQLYQPFQGKVMGAL